MVYTVDNCQYLQENFENYSQKLDRNIEQKFEIGIEFTAFLASWCVLLLCVLGFVALGARVANGLFIMKKVVSALLRLVRQCGADDLETKGAVTVGRVRVDAHREGPQDVTGDEEDILAAGCALQVIAVSVNGRVGRVLAHPPSLTNVQITVAHKGGQVEQNVLSAVHDVVREIFILHLTVEDLSEDHFAIGALG